MSKGTIAVPVSVWFTVAGTGIGLAALTNSATARLDARITRIDDRIVSLAEGRAELRERKRITRIETVLGEVRTLAAVEGPGAGPGLAAQEDGTPLSFP